MMSISAVHEPMSDVCRLSPVAVGLIVEGIAHYLTNPGTPDFDYCAGVLWSLGGYLDRGDGEQIPTPPRYDICIIHRTDIAEQGFIAIDDPVLGTVGFSPRPEDAASERRLIDHDGKDLVVR
jgi:hypothetical protein